VVAAAAKTDGYVRISWFFLPTAAFLAVGEA
jgi:hypothetical protein